MSRLVLGVDPAPSKPTVFFNGTNFDVVEPQAVRGKIEEAAHNGALIAWDAPLAFNPRNGFYSRPVDEQLDALVKVEPAVKVAPFANLSHWSISCEALGYPYGDPPSGMELVDSQSAATRGAAVIEVHPAVALLVWWRLRKHGSAWASTVDGRSRMPQYKKTPNRIVPEIIAAVGDELRCRDAVEIGLSSRLTLGKPNRRPKADDLLDAAVAHELGLRFLEDRTHVVGNRADGFIVLPAEASQWISKKGIT